MGFAGNSGLFLRIRDRGSVDGIPAGIWEEGAGMRPELERSGCSDKAPVFFVFFFLGILMRLKLCSAIKS